MNRLDFSGKFTVIVCQKQTDSFFAYIYQERILLKL